MGGRNHRRRRHKPKLPRHSNRVVPVYETMKAALPRWLQLGVSSWVADTIRDGVKIEWREQPTPFRSPEYPLNKEDTEFLRGEIQRGLDNVYIEEVTDLDEIEQLVCISSAFVAHTAQKPRAVYDYKHVNSFTDTASCKYETLPELAQSLRPNDALLTWDVKDAYHHLTLREEDRTFLAFRCLGRFFKPITMPFGLAPAPLTWTKVMRPVVQHLREKGFRMMAYVDDFGGAPPAPPGLPATQAQAIAAYKMVDNLFGTLGLKMHPVKGTRDGPTQVRLLGHLVDTRLARFLLPDDRVDKLTAMAVGLTRHATAHRRWVSFRVLRQFCGTAVSTTLSVPTARYHLRSLFTAMQLRSGNSGDVRLGRQALRDLLWWTKLQSHAATGRPLWPGAVSMTLDTDASSVGWGAVLNQDTEARGFHGLDRNGLHINCLELGAVTRALDSFRHLIPAGTILRLRTDSMVALGVIQAGSSRSPILMDQMRELHNLCAAMDIQLRVEHVSSVLNEWADRLSREHDSTDWTLSASTFQRLDALYGPHTVDLFASDLTARCARFYSRWLCPGALGTNALRHPWTDENAWANPPFHLVGAVIHRVLANNVTATLIAPAWRAQPWWQRAVDGCHEWQRLPPADGVYTRGSRSTPAPSPSWRTVVFRFVATPPCATTTNAGSS